MLVVALSSLVFILVGCGSKLEGTYSMDTPMGKASYVFDSTGKVIQDTFGMKVEMKYELDGKNIKLITPAGTTILTMPDDKTIEGSMGMKFVKEK